RERPGGGRRAATTTFLGATSRRAPGEGRRGVSLQANAATRTPADPRAITLAVPNLRVGDTIPLRRGRMFRVVGVVAGEEPALIVDAVGSERIGRGLSCEIRRRGGALNLV